MVKSRSQGEQLIGGVPASTVAISQADGRAGAVWPTLTGHATINATTEKPKAFAAAAGR